MNAISNAYNYYMTTYAPKHSRRRYNTHKPSELKDVYNSIVKMSKDSPTYLYDQSKSVYRYAVNIKEEALELKGALTALTNESDPSSIIGRKIASSSDPDTVAVEFVGRNSDSDAKTSYDIEIESLAKPQINTGKYLPGDELGLLPNDYTFELKVGSSAYEFQFHISHNDTNRSLQTRLSNLINNSDIGITAEILTKDNNMSALQITSDNTGTENNEPFPVLFEMNAPKESGLEDVVSYFGLQNITQHTENAAFTLNGDECSSPSNSFTINDTFQVKLNRPTEEGESVHIGFKTDTDTIADNIKALVSQYNSMVDTSSEYVPKNKVQSHSLSHDLSNITGQFNNSLEAIGLNPSDTGKLDVEDSLLYQALEEDTDDTVKTILNFKSALVNKTDRVLLNPMEYVNRTIVTYKNPGKNFTNPYVTSMYSGMLFNSYC